MLIGLLSSGQLWSIRTIYFTIFTALTVINATRQTTEDLRSSSGYLKEPSKTSHEFEKNLSINIRTSRNRPSTMGQSSLPAYDISGFDDFITDHYEFINRNQSSSDKRTSPMQRNKQSLNSIYNNDNNNRERRNDRYNDEIVHQMRSNTNKASKANITMDMDRKTMNMLVNVLKWANERIENETKKGKSQNKEYGVDSKEDSYKKKTIAKRQKTHKDDPLDRPSASNERISWRKQDLNSIKGTNKSLTRPDPSDYQERISRQSTALDHILVRPGFDHEKSDDKNYNRNDRVSSSSNEDSKHRRSTSSLLQSGAYQYPSTLVFNDDQESLHQPQNHQGVSLLANHKPILARDILTHPQVRNMDYISHGSNPVGPENLFVSRPRLSPIDMANHPHNLAQLARGYQPSVGSDIRSNQIEDQRLMVPPYNGHRLVGHHLQHPLAAFGGGSNEWQEPMGHPSHLQLPINNQDAKIGHGDNQKGPTDSVHPLERMLEAAKRQREAALAFERGRLQHELEMEHRQGQLRHQHEHELEEQRKSHELKAKQALEEAKEAEKRNRKEKEEQNKDSGESGESEQQNEGNEQSDQDSGNEKQSNSIDDEQDSKGFTDTDFTDLFPPGILSQDEIREIKKQQQEEKEKQRQQEQQQDQQDEADGQQQQGQDEEGNGNSQGSDGEQGEVKEEPGVEGNEASVSEQQKHEANDTKSNKSNNITDNSIDNDQPRKVLIQRANESFVEYAEVRSNKSRRSTRAPNESGHQAVTSLGRDRYLRPFVLPMASETESRRRYGKQVKGSSQIEENENAQVQFDKDDLIGLQPSRHNEDNMYPIEI